MMAGYVYFKSEQDLHHTANSIVDLVFELTKSGYELKSIKRTVIDALVSAVEVVEHGKDIRK